MEVVRCDRGAIPGRLGHLCARGGRSSQLFSWDRRKRHKPEQQCHANLAPHPLADPSTSPPSAEIAVSSVTVSVASHHGIQDAALPADVIADRVNEAPLTIKDFQACGTAGDAQWVDCSPAFPDGTPEKSWPVVFERGTKVTLSEVHLKVKNPAPDLGGSIITGTTTVGGVTLTFTSAPVTPAGGEFVIKNLTSDNALPNAVNHFPMTISWTVKHYTTTYSAGSSTIPIYLTLADPGYAPYLSLEALRPRPQLTRQRNPASSIASGRTCSPHKGPQHCTSTRSIWTRHPVRSPQTPRLCSTGLPGPSRATTYTSIARKPAPIGARQSCWNT